jgi:hypothetical protein
VSKRLVSNWTESIPGDEVDRRAWIEIVGTGKAGGIKLAPMAERSIEPFPVGAEIESLKSKLLHHATREMPDRSDDMASTIGVMVRNSCRGRLRDELYEIFKIIDKLTDKDDVGAIYNTLDRAVHWAIMAGMHNPNPALIKFRQETKGWARRAKRTANVLAQERREKMRPFVEDFLQVHGFSGPATMYKALMKRPEFVILVDEANRRSSAIDKDKGRIPKGLNPRQIKDDIEAILVTLDAEA